MLLEFSIILLLIIANGIFSMAEIALVSSRKARLEQKARKGAKGAKKALELSEEPTRFLSTVQVGITLIGILTGVFGGARLAAYVEQYLQVIPALAPYNSAIALTLVVILITYLTLVLGELAPKRIGMHNPENIAALLALPMDWLSKLSAPVVWLLSKSTNLVLNIFNIKASGEPSVTEEEIKSMIAHGTTIGMFEEVEQDIVARVFHLSDRKVGSLMTNRIDMAWIDINDDFATNKEFILRAEHVSLPVGDGSIDNIIGILYTKSFLIALSQETTVDIRSLLKKPLFIPENMSAFRVLEKFKEKKERIAIVVDEFGAVQGIITMIDLFEALVGDLETPEDNISANYIVQREDGSWLVDALLPFEEFIQHFEIDDVSAEDRTGFHTMGGFILHLSKQIPTEGEVFKWKKMTFEVLDMDGNRIDKILMTQSDDEQ